MADIKPLIFTAVEALQFDPIWFGVLEVELIPPPVALLLPSLM